MDQSYLTSLVETLKLVTVPDSAVIKEATTKLSTQFYTNQQAIPALVHILQDASTEVQLRQLAGVEARKLIAKQWESLPAEVTNSIKEHILNAAFTEQVKIIRHSIARVIAAIGSIDLDKKQWANLVPQLIQTAANQAGETREVAVFILDSLLETLSAELHNHINDLLQLFAVTIQDANLETRSLSVQALNQLSALIEEEGEIKQQYAEQFKALLPAMVSVLDAAVKAEDVVNTKILFNVMNDVLLLDSKMTGDAVVELIRYVKSFAINTEIDEDIRVFAVQFLCTAISYRKSKVSQAKLGPELALAALKISTEEIDVDNELNNEDETNENEENTPALVASRLLSIMSHEMSPSQVIIPVFEQLPALLGSANAFERRAGLLAIGATSAGAPDFTYSQLDKVMAAVFSGLKDNEIIVKLAALKLVVSLTSELQDEVSQHHSELLPLIISIIDSASNVVVYKYATYALDSVLEFTSQEGIAQYLDPLMNKLFQMLEQANSSKLKGAIVSAIGSAAFAAGKGFVPYFRNSVQHLQQYLGASIEGLSEDDIELRALTYENVSTMGRAVGSANFSEFAQPLVESSYQAIQTDNSRLREAGYAFITNMAKVYGTEFAPFLSTMIPEILKTLQLEEYSTNFDGDADELQALTQSEDVEDLANKFTVNTGITYEKEVAAAALVALSLGCKEHFLEFVEPCLSVLGEQVNESYGLREVALHTMFKVAEGVLITSGATSEYPKGVPNVSYVDVSTLAVIQTVRQVGIDNLSDEFEFNVVAQILDDFSNMIRTYGPIMIMDNGDSSSLEALCMELMKIIQGEHACQQTDFEDGLAEEEDDGSEYESVLFDSAAEVLVSLAFALGGDFNKIFESFKGALLNQINTKSKTKRVAVVGSLAEIANGMKEANAYTQELLEAFINKLSDKSLEVKGNAAYGVGVCSQYANFDISPIYEPVLKSLYDLLSKADKRAAKIDEDDETSRNVVDRALANTIGCVARMTSKNQALVPLEATIPALLNHLPLETGYEENTPIFELIMQLYQADSPAIVAHTQQVVDIFAQVFTKEFERIKYVEESTLGREENIERLKQFDTVELKAKVVEFLKFLNAKYNGVVAANPILAQVIA